MSSSGPPSQPVWSGVLWLKKVQSNKVVLLRVKKI